MYVTCMYHVYNLTQSALLHSFKSVHFKLILLFFFFFRSKRVCWKLKNTSLELWRQTACKDVTHSVAGHQRDIDIFFIIFFVAFIMLYIMKRWNPVSEGKTWRPYLGWLPNSLKAVHFYRGQDVLTVSLPSTTPGSGRSSPKIDFMTRMKTKKNHPCRITEKWCALNMMFCLLCVTLNSDSNVFVTLFNPAKCLVTSNKPLSNGEQ